tara:strand:+ start:6915 stop:7850 length:936 start_codon:yes stop_codon:yes gene_type:complete
MYKIKENPSDFIVKEQSDIVLKPKGEFTYFLMQKKDYTTMKALDIISGKLGVPLKHMGFAGTKDRVAITSQMVGVKGISREKIEGLELDDISLEVKGFGDDPISLGDLEGNWFTITVRNITKKPKKVERIINYFGEQRFSKNNSAIGKALVKRDFKKAVSLVLESNGDYERKMKDFLDMHETDYIGALRCIPRKIVMMFVHAYQSSLWNEMAAKSKSDSLPLIGFGTEENDAIVKVMKKEGITTRDFIFKEFPELSAEGNDRDVYVDVKDLVINELLDDELNNGKKKCVVSFFLSKGSYATEVIKILFKNC